MAKMAYMSPNLAGSGGPGSFSTEMSQAYNSPPSPPPPLQPQQPPPLERSPFSALTVNEPVDNIVNRKGGVNSSLYQNCLALRKRLAYVPGFEEYLTEMDQEELESGDETDPVTSMWNMLRRGFPLLAIYNAIQPRVLLTVNESNVPEAKLGKIATFRFLQACLKELGFPSEECFLITDLYGQDTTGFVKVLKLINRVLDILQQRGMLMDQGDHLNANSAAEPQRKSHQEMVIQELVTTERDYVQHLETLHHFKNQLDQSGAIPGDAIHDIFLNLNALLDFQRRFLIRIEQQNSLEGSTQNWGQLFVQYQSGFRVYEPFIANQTQCNECVMKNWEAIRGAPLSQEMQGMVTSHTVLTGFLLKPFQRLAKYPLLLDDLRKRGDYDDEKLEHLDLGSAAMKTVLDRANQALDRAHLAQESAELVGLVDDWKGHKIEHFGDLCICGSYPVLKGEGAKETEREYKIYLFERILLCCKEINPNKPKNRLAGKGIDKKGRPKLQLKGRIFIQNVTDVICVQPKGAYHLQIWWKGDPGIESFIIRFLTAEARQKWYDMVQKLRIQLGGARNAYGSNGVSDRELTSMSGVVLPNPYEQQEDDFEEEDFRISQSSTLINDSSDWSSSRNASNASLRSRSTTGGSGPPGVNGRVPPPRFPMAEPSMGFSSQPLKVATAFSQQTQTEIIEDRLANSHFSPAGDSPNSMRSSSQAGMYPFPRQHTPSNGTWPTDNKHNTAPPMGRSHGREEEYGQHGRGVQRPSLPAMTLQQSQQQMAFAQSRSRSMSSPDAHNLNGTARRLPNGQIGNGDEVPVPPIPPHMASMRGPVNRSQNNSPTDSLRNARGGSQLPNAMRHTHQQFQPSHAYDQYSGMNRSDPRYPQSAMGGPGRVLSPPVATSHPQQGEAAPYVSQLKVKVHFDPEPSHVTIVVPVIIKWRSLIDRIDSKMERVTSASIANGTARLRYRDADNALILIENDEDIQLAIEDWNEGNIDKIRDNKIPDFDLYWKETGNPTPGGYTAQ